MSIDPRGPHRGHSSFWLTASMGIAAAIGVALSFDILYGVVIIGAIICSGVVALPVQYSLVAILLLRTFSDSPALPSQMSFGLNVVIAGIATAVALRVVYEKQSSPGRIWIGAALYLVVFSLIGLLVTALPASALSDSLRMVSVLAVALMARAAAGNLGVDRLLVLIVLVSLPSAALTIIGAATQHELLYSSETSRAFGTFTHPVAAAAFFAVLGIVALHLSMLRSTRYLVLFAAYGAAVVSTGGLAGLVTLGVGVAILLVWSRAGVGVRSYVAVGSIASAGLVLVVWGGDVVARIAELSGTDLTAELDQTGATNSTTWRFRNWLALLEFWMDRPLLGWGYGAAGGVIRPLGESPHSGPVQVLVDSGALGLVGAIVLLVSGFVVVVRCCRAKGRHGALGLAVLSATFVNSLSSNTLTYIPVLFVTVTIFVLVFEDTYRCLELRQDSGGVSGERSELTRPSPLRASPTIERNHL